MTDSIRDWWHLLCKWLHFVVLKTSCNVELQKKGDMKRSRSNYWKDELEQKSGNMELK